MSAFNKILLEKIEFAEIGLVNRVYCGWIWILQTCQIFCKMFSNFPTCGRIIGRDSVCTINKVDLGIIKKKFYPRFLVAWNGIKMRYINTVFYDYLRKLIKVNFLELR